MFFVVSVTVLYYSSSMFIILFLYRIGILVVSLGYTFPFSVHLHHQDIVGKINASAPFLFKYPNYCESLFHRHYINTRLEVIAGSNGVHIPVKLFYVELAIGLQRC